MSIQRYLAAQGRVRYRARVKWHGREVATRVFDRKRDAEAWESEQVRRLRMGEWFDPRRGLVPLSRVAPGWLESRAALKRSTRSFDRTAWTRHIEPAFGRLPVASITPADVSSWTGRLAQDGMSPASAARYLQALRSLLAFAVADSRIASNPAAKVKPPTGGGRLRREGQFLTVAEVEELRAACRGRHGDVVEVLAFTGLRWGELAGLQAGDRISVPGDGLRVRRAILASKEKGELYEETVKTGRSRTVPLVERLGPIVDAWSTGKPNDSWLFAGPGGGPLRETNWKRSVHWKAAIRQIGRPTLRVHDLRHTAASIWIGAGADPKVVQRILGHASAAMTMDLYGHLIDQNLWDAAKRLGGISGAFGADPAGEVDGGPDGQGADLR